MQNKSRATPGIQLMCVCVYIYKVILVKVCAKITTYQVLNSNMLGDNYKVESSAICFLIYPFLKLFRAENVKEYLQWKLF